MEFEKFIKIAEQAVKERLGKNFEVKAETCRKNNDTLHTGLRIRRRKEPYALIIYLEDYYRLYQAGAAWYESLFDGIVREYQDLKKRHTNLEERLRFLGDYDHIKGKILFRLVNTAKNATKLREVPQVPFLDLSLVFYILIEGIASRDMFCQITKKNLEKWGVTVKELYEAALENTPQLYPAKFQSIQEALGEAQEEELKEITVSMPELPGLFVLTNGKGTFGAAVLVYQGLLKSLAKRLGRDFIILPSSIHEVLLLTDTERQKEGELNQMIQEINKKVVSAEEVLSNHMYIYRQKENCLEMEREDGTTERVVIDKIPVPEEGDGL